ncbi:CPBP family intramembrane glutamic endopeptidase [Heyndrickxia ginsengihumi]|uniref:CPBP family intramembrane metalloprotease n=1 Tax=Heyndrickxia ginsengihumi TaxID=363870 RepID=A0A0A6VGR9_9BACI|nr:CPBP family intramembrane glutamic endopeptidase [Heyndrickxia ginsengihumi]KHD85799.1 membrane protein [Heyndrickxia ginsengihumi]MBE6183455.1 CPBP family intramembrane metalloprotease [Bacillus sp. (in: firmicutes)]MCM3022894.1 CPBP family intramembrane metalloprotease [Heyndrickxia ginsengihumi]NEY20678.1 CPBP family intramembrane metalloprotease [Heyndrickxia ginsengihumi]
MKKKSQAEIIQTLSDKELTFHLIFTQLLLLIIALILGLWLFKDLSSFLSLFRIDMQVLTYGVISGILVVMLDFLFMWLLPEAYYDDGGVNKKIFQHRSILQIFMLTLLIAVSEELLFRGVIQTHTGIIVASIIFAIVHIRYWKHWYLVLNVLILSFWLGLVYEISQHNLITTMVMHFIIDFLLGIQIKRKGN